MLGNALARIEYGSRVEDGDFREHSDEYREVIGGMEDIDVQVEEWYDAAPYTSFLTPTEMETGEATAENLTGEEAWNFADQALEEMTDGKGLEDIPFHFQHRSRGNHDHIHLGATKYSLLGSTTQYHVTFDS